MKIKIAAILALLTQLAMAATSDLAHRPRTFLSNNKKVVFVDFISAEYNITYNLEKSSARVRAVIHFNMPETGRPVFDSLETPITLLVDGKSTAHAGANTPNRQTSVRIVDKVLSVGSHVMEIETPILIRTSMGNIVESKFWINNLHGGHFLEHYIPTNLEYDRFKQVFHVKFIGLQKKQQIFANGDIVWNGDDQATITFPEYFTTSSLFFHTTPADSFEVVHFEYQSAGNVKIPVTIYQMLRIEFPSLGLEALKSQTIQHLRELEAEYGPYPHKSLTIHAAHLNFGSYDAMPLEGMHYAGAVVTNQYSLARQLFHLWFGRAVVSADGNSGWFGQAMGTWRDEGYPRWYAYNERTWLAGHPEYTRLTTREALAHQGSTFMSYLDGKLEPKGGLKSFMRRLLVTKLFIPMSTQDFIEEMEAFAGISLMQDFINYTGHRPPSPRVKTQKN